VLSFSLDTARVEWGWLPAAGYPEQDSRKAHQTSYNEGGSAESNVVFWEDNHDVK
jgi:hypothetical protein